MNTNYKRLTVLASILLSLLILPAIVGAQPDATPPSGNVSAEFDSLRVGGGLSEPGSGNAFIDGGLGIGTENLQYGANLEVADRVNVIGSSDPRVFIGEDGSNYLDIRYEDSGNYGGITTKDSTQPLALQELGGNVGIGTASPSYKLQTQGDIYANGGWLRVAGPRGLYFQSYGGGWHMLDTTWIRSYGGKRVYIDNYLRADGGLYVGNDEYFYRTSEDFIRTGDHFQSDASVRAPIFYDSNNTSRRLDPTGSSYLTNVRAYGYVRGASVGRFYAADGPLIDPQWTTQAACYNEPWWGAPLNKYCTLYAYCGSSAGTSDIAISAMPGVQGTYAGTMNWNYVGGGISGNKGYSVFQTNNRNAAPTSVRGRVVCFSPDG